MPTYYVDERGSDLTGDGSFESPYASVTKAVTIAIDGDTIEVADGTYTESSYVTINKALTINGASRTGTIIKSSHAGQIFYLNNSKVRVFSNFTLENTSTVSGPGNLLATSGASLNLTTTCTNVGFHDGRTGAISLASGDYGLTLDECVFDLDISNTQVIRLAATAGNLTITDCTFNVTSAANASINGIISQLSAATAGVLTVTGNTFNIDKGVYVIRINAGGFAAGSNISNNTLNITSATYTRPAILLTDFATSATCDNNTVTINATSTTSTPIQFVSTVGTGPDCVWSCQNNTISTHNVDGYGILMGDEGGDVTSKKDAFNGSTIKNNTIYTGNYFGEAIGGIHSIMVGGNKNMIVEGNTVYHGTYGVVAKGADAWTSGYMSENIFINCKYGTYAKGQQDIKMVNNTYIGENGTFLKGVLAGDLGDGTKATGTYAKNNIFKINTGSAYDMEAGCTTGITIDYSGYELSGTAKAASLAGTDYADLAAMQTAGYDTNSISGDMKLQSDYSIVSGSPAYKTGAFVKGVNHVIDKAGISNITLSSTATTSTNVPFSRRTPSTRT